MSQVSKTLVINSGTLLIKQFKTASGDERPAATGLHSEHRRHRVPCGTSIWQSKK